jgi:hypothetical protein
MGGVFVKKVKRYIKMESYITNCVIAVSKRDRERMEKDSTFHLFQESPDGHVIVRLDGYAIVPEEDYEKYKLVKNHELEV